MYINRVNNKKYSRKNMIDLVKYFDTKLKRVSKKNRLYKRNNRNNRNNDPNNTYLNNKLNNISGRLIDTCNKILIRNENACQCFDSNNYPSNNSRKCMLKKK